MLDVILLNQFLSVVKRMNFTKAADDLYTSHSTISRNMAKLEESLDTKLFIRSRHTVSLTSAGKYLAENGGLLLQQMNELEMQVRKIEENENSKLRLGMFNFYNKQVFQKYQQFKDQYPDIDLSIKHMELDDIASAVYENKLDIGITYSFALKDRSDILIKPILDGEFVAMVSSSHPLAEKDFIDIDDPALSEPLVFDAGEYDLISNIGRESSANKKNLRLRKVDSLESFVLQIKANMGIGLLPEHTATQMGNGCSFLNIDWIDSSYQIVMFCLKDQKKQSVRDFYNLFSDMSITKQ